MNTMFDPGSLSSLSGAFMFLVLSVLLLINWRGQRVAGLLILASVLSALLFTAQAYYPMYDGVPSVVSRLLEVARNTAWLSFLYVVLSQQSAINQSRIFRLVVPLVAGLVLLLSVVIVYPELGNHRNITILTGVRTEYVAFIAMTLFGLLLLEKLYRSTNPAGRWALKFMCFGIGGIFAYDLFLYSDAVLFKSLEMHLLDARGLINGICVPLIALSVVRNPNWEMKLFVSRHVIYHSTAALAAGIYMIIMAGAGYYVRNYGGVWGPHLQIVFLFGALIMLVVLFFSTELRARLKIFLAKHFYKNKYDYREEWLGFVRTLAENTDNTEIYRTIIKAVCEVVKSPGGALWLTESDGYLALADKTVFHDHVQNEISADDELVGYMKTHRWIINIDEYKVSARKYNHLVLPGWIISSERIWLLLPLFNGDTLSGLMMLARPHGNVSFDWEDVDLLKTVGFQTAAYIALLRTTDALSEARQFETFNRLSAFMVHDLKNVVAQLTFITSNFPKYRDKPEFMDDAVETISHASDKMKKLLGSLGKGQVVSTPNLQKVDLAALLGTIITRRSLAQPEPVLRKSVTGLIVRVEKDKLASALEHLIQNAQEAAEASGHVWLDLEQQDNQARIMIVDDGCGMDEEFIKTRLFKPFDTTKGNAGMGIGVYESREIIRETGGSIRVASSPGVGTEFTIVLPCLDETSGQVSNQANNAI